MEKYIKDGKVGVLISYGFGAGWSSWNNINWALDKRIIEKFISDGDDMKKEDWDIFMLSIEYDGYCGGYEGLDLEFVDEGCYIQINEYDGAESLQIGFSNFVGL